MSFPPEPAVQAAILDLLAERAKVLAAFILHGPNRYELVTAGLAELERLLAQAKGPER